MTFDSSDIPTVPANYGKRTPAQIFALAISTGHYKTGSFMCNALGEMMLAGKITNIERLESVNTIQIFVNSRSAYTTLRGYLALHFKCQTSEVYNLALALYSDWDNRHAILAAPFEHDNRHKSEESYDE